MSRVDFEAILFYAVFCGILRLAKNVLNRVRDFLHTNASLWPLFTCNKFLSFQDAQDFSEEVH